MKKIIGLKIKFEIDMIISDIVNDIKSIMKLPTVFYAYDLPDESLKYVGLLQNNQSIKDGLNKIFHYRNCMDPFDGYIIAIKE